MGNLISKTEFAKMCGVTQGAVTKFVQGRGEAAVVGNRIDLDHSAAIGYVAEKTAPRPVEPVPGVDHLFEQALLACEETQRWNKTFLEKHFKISRERAERIFKQLQAAGHAPEKQVAAPTTPQPKKPSTPKTKKPSHVTVEQDEMADKLDEFMTWTLGQILTKYGSVTGFNDWLRALRDIEMVTEKRIKNAQLDGRLVNRALVETAILDRIDGTFIKLLTDAATTISSRAYAIVKAGEDEKALKKMVEDQLASFIRPAKEQMRRALKQ